MDIKERIEAIKNAISPILNYGDNFTIKKNKDGLISVEVIDEEKSKKIYKTRAILRKYNKRTLIVIATMHVILFSFLLFIFLMIAEEEVAKDLGLNISYLNHWFVYIGLFIIYIYFINMIAQIIRKIYVFLRWNSILGDVNYIQIDEVFLQNEFGIHKEYFELVSIIADKLSLQKEKDIDTYYNTYEK